MHHSVITGVILLSVGGASAWADDGELVKQEADATTALIQAELKNWQCRSATQSGDYSFSPQPVLRWSNPAAGRVYGDVYVCTDAARPVALFCFYKWYAPYNGFEAEVHSLSPSPLAAQRDSEPIWRPQAGVQFQPVPDVTPPAENKAARMVQMRRIARRFTAHLADRRLDRNADAEPHTLRLLAEPIYRFGGNSDVIDGALFAFVFGTDPEVILMLQASGRDPPT